MILSMEDSSRPKYKETIHNHPTYCDDMELRRYLKNLDDAEAKAIYGYARSRGRTDFEWRKPNSNTRYNCNMEYDDGAYIATIEGRE